MSTEHSNTSTEDLSIGAVVINYNGGKKILTCIDALLKQKSPLQEIVVVDNGSNDGSPEKIHSLYAKVKLLSLGDNKGPSVARNSGLKWLTTSWALLIDADVYVEADCIDALINAATLTNAAVICPRIHLLPNDDIVQAEGADVHFIGTFLLQNAFTPARNISFKPRYVGGCISACMLVKRQPIIDSGGFDEIYFFYFEDMEFSYRMRSLGQQFYYEPSAVVLHDRGAGLPGLSYRGTGDYPDQRMYYHVRNRLLTILIHYQRLTLLLLAPVLISYEMISLLFLTSRGGGRYWFEAMGWLFNNNQLIRERRRNMQGKRRDKDLQILRGGPLPLAPGLIQSKWLRSAIAAVSAIFNFYWIIIRKLII